MNRIARFFSHLFCVLLVFLTILIFLSTIILSVAVVQSRSGSTLNLFGYQLLISDSSDIKSGLPADAAVLVQNIPHEDFEKGDYIICLELDENHQYYPVTRIFELLDEEMPSSVLVREIGSYGGSLAVNRDDIVGKQIYVSETIGKLLKWIQAPSNRVYLFSLIGLLLFLTVCLFLLFRLSKHREHLVDQQASAPQESVDLKEWIEKEDVPLVHEEVKNNESN